MLVDSWGKILGETTDEDIMNLCLDLDFSNRVNIKLQIPIENQRRIDILMIQLR